MARWIPAVLMVLVLSGAVAIPTTWDDSMPVGTAYCAEGEEQPVQQMTWWDSIKAGGVVGAIIILCSVAALALSIQYAVEMKHDRLIPPHVVAELEQMFEEGSYEEAVEYCQAEDCYLTRIVGAGLAQMDFGYDAMAGAITTASDEETTTLLQKLNILSTLSTVAPMLGLYGTVTGMIIAFQVIASTQGGATPAQLAYGISQALVTTFEGLTVAMPLIIVYKLLQNRVIKVYLEMQTIVTNLFGRFRKAA
jgi:biopolymer transport protein ExbB